MASDLSWLDGIGISASSVDTDYKFADTVDGIAMAWLYNLKKEGIPDKLKQKDVIGGGGQSSKLAGDASIIITEVSAGTQWTLSMNDYWKYVENGRGPTTGGGDGAVKRAIKTWITWKGINPSDILVKMAAKNGKAVKPLPFPKALESLSYIIARSIHRKGYSDWRKARHGNRGALFIKETLTENVPSLKEALETKLGRAIQIRVVTDLKGLK